MNDHIYTCILRKTIEGCGFCFDFIAKGIIIIFSTQIINRYCKSGNFRENLIFANIRECIASRK